MFDTRDHEVAVDAGPEYHRRRESVSRAALDWRPGDPLPAIDYTPEEQAVWSAVCRRLYTLHAHHACADYLRGWETLALPTARIPALPEVNARLEPATGFRLTPSAGWVPDGDYHEALAEGRFPTTLHLRWDRAKAGGGDPDLLHSLLGHGVLLASPRFARLHRAMGEAGCRVESARARDVLARVFWFTCETGVVAEHGRVVCCGARMLGSPDAMEAFRTAEMRPLDLPAMARGEGGGQTLYRADSAEDLEERVCAFLAAFDDDTPDRLGA